MKIKFAILSILLAVVGGTTANAQQGSTSVRARAAVAVALASGPPTVKVAAPPKSKVRKPRFRIRLLILRHSADGIAVTDAKAAAAAIKEAKSLGLDAEVVGDVDCTGGVSAVKAAVEQACKYAKGGTLVIHTIGHGFRDGSLQNLGQRTTVLKAIANTVNRHKQRALWWQLSCFALAGLPKDTGSSLLTVVSSSPADHVSQIGNQSRMIRRVLLGLSNGKDLDADGDGIITVKELADYLNKADAMRRGDLITGTCDPFCPCDGTTVPKPAEKVTPIVVPQPIIRQVIPQPMIIRQNCPT